KVPFLDISREFWRLASSGGKEHLLAGMGAQAELTRSSLRDDAVAALITGLAQALRAWAVYLPLTYGELSFWPSSAEPMLSPLRREVRTLNSSSVHSAATFALRGSEIIVYPIFAHHEVCGFLCIGTERKLTKTDRQIIHTV